MAPSHDKWYFSPVHFDHTFLDGQEKKVSNKESANRLKKKKAQIQLTTWGERTVTHFLKCFNKA